MKLKDDWNKYLIRLNNMKTSRLYVSITKTDFKLKNNIDYFEKQLEIKVNEFSQQSSTDNKKEALSDEIESSAEVFAAIFRNQERSDFEINDDSFLDLSLSDSSIYNFEEGYVCIF